MNIAARTTRWTRSTAVCKMPAKTRPAAEADNRVKYWPCWSEQQSPAIRRGPEIHPAPSLITVHSCGDRDTFGGKTFSWGMFLELRVWSTGLAAHGQTRLFSLLFPHPFPVLKGKKFIARARAVRKGGGWRKGFNLQNGIEKREMADSSPERWQETHVRWNTGDLDPLYMLQTPIDGTNLSNIMVFNSLLSSVHSV